MAQWLRRQDDEHRLAHSQGADEGGYLVIIALGLIFLVPRRNLWAIDGLNRVTCEGRKAGSASPDGTADCASARRIAVKPCACGAPLCGFGA